MIKFRIKTHSGSEYEVEVTDYNAAETNEKLNRNDVNTVAFGNVIISRIDVKSIVPVEEHVVQDVPVDEKPVDIPVEEESAI
ncbi:hypothetical protein [Niallia sp. FSL R7-0271]|uniref:hypothetical protein n=1 Tax=Niallia sp. FSL R7-0271 TaxID=2921678 RepID=UPI0030F60C8E